MNWQSISFDWNQVRAFLATVEEGSLSAAARATGQTQPTIGRQVAGLEEALGITLFERVGKSLVLTEAGTQVLSHVRSMGDAASRISLAASGQAQTVDGVVRISTSDVFSAFLLPPFLAELAIEFPKIRVEVVASNSISDLQRREADIAIRHVRPTQPDLIARLMTQEKARFYGTADLIAACGGPPKSKADLERFPFIAFGEPKSMQGHMAAIGVELELESFAFWSENGVTAWAMAREGLGIAPMSVHVGKRTPGMVDVYPEMEPIEFPVWLTTHRELHTSARIRVVFDRLAEFLRQMG